MEVDTPEDSSTGDTRAGAAQAAEVPALSPPTMEVDSPKDLSTGELHVAAGEAPKVSAEPESVAGPSRDQAEIPPRPESPMTTFLNNVQRMYDAKESKREESKITTYAQIKQVMDIYSNMSLEDSSWYGFPSRYLKEGESSSLDFDNEKVAAGEAPEAFKDSVELEPKPVVAAGEASQASTEPEPDAGPSQDKAEISSRAESPMAKFLNDMQRVCAMSKSKRAVSPITTYAQIKELMDMYPYTSSQDNSWFRVPSRYLKEGESVSLMDLAKEKAAAGEAQISTESEPVAGPSHRAELSSVSFSQLVAISERYLNPPETGEIAASENQSAKLLVGEFVSSADSDSEKWNAFWEAHRHDKEVIPRPSTPTVVSIRSPISDLKFWDEDAQLEPPTGKLAETSLEDASGMDTSKRSSLDSADTSKRSSSESADTLKESPPISTVKACLAEYTKMDIPKLSPLSSADDVSKDATSVDTPKKSSPPSVDVSKSATSALKASQLSSTASVDVSKGTSTTSDEEIREQPDTSALHEEVQKTQTKLEAIFGAEAPPGFLSILSPVVRSPQRSPSRKPVDTSRQSSSSSEALRASRKRLLERDEEDLVGPTPCKTTPDSEGRIKAEAGKTLAEVLAQEMNPENERLRAEADRAIAQVISQVVQSPQQSPLKVPLPENEAQIKSEAGKLIAQVVSQVQDEDAQLEPPTGTSDTSKPTPEASTDISKSTSSTFDEEGQKEPTTLETLVADKAEALRLAKESPEVRSTQGPSRAPDDGSRQSSSSSAASLLPEDEARMKAEAERNIVTVQLSRMIEARQSPVAMEVESAQPNTTEASMDDSSQSSASGMSVGECPQPGPSRMPVEERPGPSRASVDEIQQPDSSAPMSLKAELIKHYYEIIRRGDSPPSTSSEMSIEEFPQGCPSGVSVADSEQPGPSGVSTQHHPPTKIEIATILKKLEMLDDSILHLSTLPIDELDDILCLRLAAICTVKVLKRGKAPFSFFVCLFGDIVINHLLMFDMIKEKKGGRNDLDIELKRLCKVNYSKILEIERLIKQYAVNDLNRYCYGALQYIRATVHQLDVLNHSVYRARGLTSISNKRMAQRIYDNVSEAAERNRSCQIRIRNKRDMNLVSQFFNRFESARLARKFYEYFYDAYKLLRLFLWEHRMKHMPDGIIFATEELPAVRDEQTLVDKELSVIVNTKMLELYLKQEDLEKQRVVMDRSALCEYVESYIARERNAEDNFNRLLRQLVERIPSRDDEDTEEDSVAVQALKNILFTHYKIFVDLLEELGGPFKFLIEAILLIFARTMDLLLCLDLFKEKFIATEQNSRQRIMNRPEQVEYNKRFEQYVAEIKNVLVGLQEYVYRKIIAMQVKLKSIKNARYGRTYNSFVDLCRLRIHKLDCININRIMYESAEYNSLVGKISDYLWVVKRGEISRCMRSIYSSQPPLTDLPSAEKLFIEKQPQLFHDNTYHKAANALLKLCASVDKLQLEFQIKIQEIMSYTCPTVDDDTDVAAVAEAVVDSVVDAAADVADAPVEVDLADVADAPVDNSASAASAVVANIASAADASADTSAADTAADNVEDL